MQIFEAVLENKPFIMNVYRCVHREQVERYLKPLVDKLVFDVINEEPDAARVRDEDKAFIARAYSYIFVGVMLDWVKDDMKADPKDIVERLATLTRGSVAEALKRFRY